MYVEIASASPFLALASPLVRTWRLYIHLFTFKLSVSVHSQ